MRLAVLDDYQNVALAVCDWSAITDRVDITVFNDHLERMEAVAERLAPFDIVVVNRERTPFPRTLFEMLPRLKLLITGGMRNQSIDLEAAREQGVTVCGTEGQSASTAEFTWGLILATVRGIPTQVQSVRQGGWQVGLGIGLQGKTLGVIGLGRQGAAVARIGKAFAMDVVAWSENLTRQRCDAEGVRHAASKREFLAQSDIVTIHLVLSDRTRGLIDSQALSWMKPGSYLINTSRGPIVEETALLTAIRDGQIAGAGLDVFDTEPLPPDHPYRHTPGIVATPHLGYVTRETYRQFFGQGVEDIDAWLKGAPIRVMNG